MTGTQKCYLYDPRTYVFLHEAEAEVQNGKVNLPAFSTLTPPPDIGDPLPDGLSLFWSKEGQFWETRPDFSRETWYSTETREVVTLLAGEIPNQALVTRSLPEDPRMEWNKDTHTWELPIEILRADKKAEIRKIWFESIGGPYKTGVMGKTVKEGTDEEEEIELITNFVEETRDFLRQKPFSIALEWASSDKVKATKTEIKQLKRGVYVERIMNLLADVPVVVRDYMDRYVTIKLSDLDTVIWAQAEQDQKNLHRKWAIDDLIKRARNKEELMWITWDMDLPEEEA